MKHVPGQIKESQKSSLGEGGMVILVTVGRFETI